MGETPSLIKTLHLSSPDVHKATCKGIWSNSNEWLLWLSETQVSFLRTRNCVNWQGQRFVSVEQRLTASLNGDVRPETVQQAEALQPSSLKPNAPLESKLPTGARPVWIGASELWYAPGTGSFQVMTADGASAPVTKEDRLPKDAFCRGEVALQGEPRVLATCTGTRWYTDGELDAIFGYTRFAVFDVASRRILWRANEAAFSLAAFSPSGRTVAILHREQLSFYRVP